MLIEINTLPTEIQQQISKIEQGESVSFSKNGKIFANLNAITNPATTKVSAYDLLMSFDYPEGLADIDLEISDSPIPTKESMEIFD